MLSDKSNMKILMFTKNPEMILVYDKMMKEYGYSIMFLKDESQIYQKLDTDLIDIMILDTKSFEKFKKALPEITKIKCKTYYLGICSKDDKYTKNEALRLGLDDYIYDDISVNEIYSKLYAITRTIMKLSNSNDLNLQIDDLILNPITREVTRGGKEIILTNKEFLLLDYLMRNKNNVLSRGMIGEKIWDIDFISETNIVDVYINFLRKKIDHGVEKKLIQTVRSVGYSIKDK